MARRNNSSISVSKRHNKNGSVTKTVRVSRKNIFGVRQVETFSYREQDKSALNKSAISTIIGGICF